MDIRIINSQKLIPEGHRVFVLHAGRNKKFFKNFMFQNCVFFDLPELDLPTEFEVNDDLKSKLHMAKAWAIYLDRYSNIDPPSRDPKDYDPKTGLEDEKYSRMDPQNIRAIQELYSDANAGDLVVCCGKGYNSPVLIGELLDYEVGAETVPKIAIESYGGREIPYRPVKWLSKNRTRFDFTFDFSQLLSNRSAMIRVPRSRLKEAYDYAYGEYSMADQASISLDVSPANVEGDIDLSTIPVDPLQLRSATDLALYFNAFFNAIELDNVDEFLSLNSIGEAASSRFYKDDPLAVEYDIHSPGEVVFRMHNEIKAIFIAAFLSLSSGPVSADVSVALESGEEFRIEIQNDWPTEAEDCYLGLSEKFRTALNFMNADTWERICRQRQEFSADLDFNSGTKVEPQS
ncbi:hypothetical protein TDB9533_03559 [Thalassocella blandensis]|nr:hypothetical protein TDB9533_03559 [Thalassocella blandensis]